MSVSYDVFVEAFLSKIKDYDLSDLSYNARVETVDGYLRRSVSKFKRVCRYNLSSTADNLQRVFDVQVAEEDLDEIVDIVSEGMVVQWLKPYVNNQEVLESSINTRDYTSYSPAELLSRIGSAYERSSKEYTKMIREYSFNTGDLSTLHM